MTIASVNMLKNEKSMSKKQSRNSMAKSHELPDIDKLEENRRTINQQIDRKSKMQSIAFCLSHLIDDYIASVNMLKNENSMSKTQSRNSMAKSHELPDIDKLEENRGTINQQIDRKSKMQSIAFCLSHLIDDFSFCKYAEK